MLGILTGIMSVAVTVTKALAVTGLAIQALKTIGNALAGLAKALGLLKPETQVDELGDKALQAEEQGIVPDNFDSYLEYAKAVEDFELDSEKSKLIPDEEKIKKGMEVASGLAIEKYDQYPMDKLLVEIGKKSEFFTEAKIGEIGKLINENGQYISDIVGFVDGSEKNRTKLAGTIETMTNIEKKVNPSLSDNEALKAVLNARR